MGSLFGIGIEVYIFLTVLGLPIFFFWRWIFRKSKGSGRRRFLIWILTIITTPVFYAVLILIWVFASEYYPNRDFDAKLWQTDKDTRYEYTQDIIKSRILLGKNKKEVIQLLGDDADTSQANELGYDIGFRPEVFGIDPSYLIIDFKNAKVDTVIEHDR